MNLLLVFLSLLEVKGMPPITWIGGYRRQPFVMWGRFGGVHAKPDYVDVALISIFQIHLEEGPGGILVL